MIAELINSATFKKWVGPVVPDSTTRPYVFSELVPDGFEWIILAASATDSFPNNESVFLYAIGPDFARKQSDPPVLRPDIFTQVPISNQFNVPPIRRSAVQISKGSANFGQEQVCGNTVGGGEKGSVNLLTPWSRNRILPARWMLLAAQDVNGGGGSGYMTLEAMVIERPVEGALSKFQLAPHVGGGGLEAPA